MPSKPKAKVQITPNDEAEIIAADLIPRFHQHLIDAGIRYLFTTQKRKDHDQQVLATSQRLGPLHRYLATGSVDESIDFVILFDIEEWACLSKEDRVALTDHELTHCWQNEKGKFVMVGHPVQEFPEIIARHGPWTEAAKLFLNAAAQYEHHQQQRAAKNDPIPFKQTG